MLVGRLCVCYDYVNRYYDCCYLTTVSSTYYIFDVLLSFMTFGGPA
jgi:hypothetical protein